MIIIYNLNIHGKFILNIIYLYTCLKTVNNLDKKKKKLIETVILQKQ